MNHKFAKVHAFLLWKHGVTGEGNSFASNGECGLKRCRSGAWPGRGRNSFASNGECGLKQPQRIGTWQLRGKFIRQQWRMWIETLLAQPSR